LPIGREWNVEGARLGFWLGAFGGKLDGFAGYGQAQKAKKGRFLRDGFARFGRRYVESRSRRRTKSVFCETEFVRSDVLRNEPKSPNAEGVAKTNPRREAMFRAFSSLRGFAPRTQIGGDCQVLKKRTQPGPG
jgi:hypothetical protein